VRDGCVLRAVTGSGLRTPVVPRFRGSWLRRVLLAASWVVGTWLLRPQATPAATRTPDLPRTVPRSLRLHSLPARTSQRFRHRPAIRVPPSPSRIPAGSGATEPTPVDGGSHGPCGWVVADLVPSWAMPPAGPAVLVSVGGPGTTAGTPDGPG
jgi:hypothetical protein